jgi:putative transposase
MTVENTVWNTRLSAISIRNIKFNFIFLSDQGVLYAANKMSRVLMENVKITQSMSRKGNCWNNAATESLFKTIKQEYTKQIQVHLKSTVI